MNQTILALHVLFGALGLFTIITFILDKIRRKFRVVATSNTNRPDVPDVIIYDNMTYNEAVEACDKMNEGGTELDKYYYFIYRKSHPLKL